ncbi:hypothetical protein OFM35_33525, partial [Escherichia coli]|nr:hypothetical protein [Escherichia coli]
MKRKNSTNSAGGRKGDDRKTIVISLVVEMEAEEVEKGKSRGEYIGTEDTKKGRTSEGETQGKLAMGMNTN